MIPFDPRSPARPNPALAERIPAHDAMRSCVLLNDSFERDELARHWGPLGPEARPYFHSALAEFEVAQALASLPTGWRIVHSIPIAGGGVLQHLVIGRGGVFVIRAVRRADARIVVDDKATHGLDPDDVPTVERVARYASRVLSAVPTFALPVVPVLVVTGAKSLRVRVAPRHAVVLDDDRLAAWLAARPVVLTSRQVDTIATAAEDPTSWGVSDEKLTQPSAAEQFWMLYARVLLIEPASESKPARPGLGGAFARLFGRAG